ncbi:unnamed protein product [Caenorhabditis nigoni]
MREILAICLCLASSLHAENNENSTSTTTSLVDNAFASTATPSSPINIEEELAKIPQSCLTSQDHEQLLGNSIRNVHARAINKHFIEQAEKIIAYTEMRAALGLAPPGPWKHYKYPTQDKLLSASSVEEYFELKERHLDRSLDSFFFFEKNLPPIIALLDERTPAIRTILKRKFQEIVRVDLGGRIDKKSVDYIIHEYERNIYSKVHSAINEVFDGVECWKNLDIGKLF